MSATAPFFFLTAAEHSGDALGAALIVALRRQFPAARFIGVGGALMEGAGCKLLANPVKRSAMLAGALLTQSWYWWKLMRQIRRVLSGAGDVGFAGKPDVVIPIDSSFVNLRIAAAAKKEGLPVCYYVAPQLWASRPGRIARVRAGVDTLCCVLPFEEKYFRDRGVRAVYVGHPMFDVPVEAQRTDGGIAPRVETGAGAGAMGTDDPAVSRVPGKDSSAVAPVPGTESSAVPRVPGTGPNVAIFPGSRRAEVDANMPGMLKVLQQIKGRHPRARFVAAAPSEERAWQIRHHLRVGNTPVEIRVGTGDSVIAWADLVLCKSGTTTLQVARQAKAMVVMFAVPRWQWMVAKHFIHTPYIALVNILAGKEIVKEFIPYLGKPGPVAKACLELLNDGGMREEMEGELRGLVATLMPREGMLAADRVAGEVGKLVGCEGRKGGEVHEAGGGEGAGDKVTG